MSETQVLNPALTVRNLCARFTSETGELIALQGVSFAVAEREFVCVLGPSGSGKSTLLRILAGLLEPTSGEVRHQQANPKIGVVFQQSNLMPWRTVVENISLPLELAGAPPEEAQRQARAWIERMGLHGFDETYPRDLSGGMAQRVAIARALIQEPDLLLLDEPFGMLDALTRERMGVELLRLWQERQTTVIMVTHSISEAIFLSDRVLVLTARPGRICLDLPVVLPRPRDEDMRYTPIFGELSRHLRNAIAC